MLVLRQSQADKQSLIYRIYKTGSPRTYNPAKEYVGNDFHHHKHFELYPALEQKSELKAVTVESLIGQTYMKEIWSIYADEKLVEKMGC